MSFHLKELDHAGLVTSTRDGRFVRYAVRVEGMRQLLTYLTEDCCRANPSYAAPSSRRPALFVPVRKRKRCAQTFRPANVSASEFLGSAFLLATVIGSGIMGARLSGGNEALALVGKHVADRSHARRTDHDVQPDLRCPFQSGGDGRFWLKQRNQPRLALGYILAQLAGGIAGVLAAH